MLEVLTELGEYGWFVVVLLLGLGLIALAGAVRAWSGGRRG